MLAPPRHVCSGGYKIYRNPEEFERWEYTSTENEISPVLVSSQLFMTRLLRWYNVTCVVHVLRKPHVAVAGVGMKCTWFTCELLMPMSDTYAMPTVSGIDGVVGWFTVWNWVTYKNWVKLIWWVRDYLATKPAGIKFVERYTTLVLIKHPLLFPGVGSCKLKWAFPVWRQLTGGTMLLMLLRRRRGYSLSYPILYSHSALASHGKKKP